MKVEVAVLDSPTLIVRTVSVDVKQQGTETNTFCLLPWFTGERCHAEQDSSHPRLRYLLPTLLLRRESSGIKRGWALLHTGQEDVLLWMLCFFWWGVGGAVTLCSLLSSLKTFCLVFFKDILLFVVFLLQKLTELSLNTHMQLYFCVLSFLTLCRRCCSAAPW